jgi:hypothetical protein
VARLVVCCDGTWNVPDEARHGVAAPTNVAKLALAVESGADQRLFYEPGVGTAPGEHLLGGATGYGLSRNIINAYRFLAEAYQPDDDIFLFGFSRGAYTARSLAGLIRNSGVLKPEHVGRIDDAYALYRDRTSHSHPSALASRIFRRMYAHHEEQAIHFIGVWDTVGALGIPSDLPGWGAIAEAFPGWEQRWGFHDTQLSRTVSHAFHGLSIDEQRPPYRPTLWTQGTEATDQELHQVWFAGVHSEVGGGARDPSLSDIALGWMVSAARSAGLVFREKQPEAGEPEDGVPPMRPDYAGPLVDSRRGVWAAVHPYHRLREVSIDEAPAQTISSSAARRFEERIGGYAPPGLEERLAASEQTPVPEGGA